MSPIRRLVAVLGVAGAAAAGLLVAAPVRADDASSARDFVCVATSDPVSNGLCIPERSLMPSTYIGSLPRPTVPTLP